MNICYVNKMLLQTGNVQAQRAIISLNHQPKTATTYSSPLPGFAQ